MNIITIYLLFLINNITKTPLSSLKTTTKKTTPSHFFFINKTKLDENNITWLKDLTKKRIINNFGAIRDNNKHTFQMLVEGRPDLMQEIFLK